MSEMEKAEKNRYTILSKREYSQHYLEEIEQLECKIYTEIVAMLERMAFAVCPIQ